MSRTALVTAIANKAAADQAAKLDGDAAVIRSRLAKMPPSSAMADPGAHALATYLAPTGLPVPAALLTEWLALVPVLALEIGAALAMVLVQAVSGGPVTSRTAATGVEQEPHVSGPRCDAGQRRPRCPDRKADT